MKNPLKIILKVMIICFSLIFLFVVGFAKVDGDSMLPTLKDNQLIVFQKILNNYKRFDIVIVYVDNKLYIKRVVALPGETVKYVDDKLYINNNLILENYKRTRTDDFDLNIVVPDNEFLLLGDNRSNSYDGRDFGLINISNIKGKLLFKLF